MNVPQAWWLGTVDYSGTFDKQREFTDTRDEQTADQVWCLEHPPVYTLGLAGKPEHLLNPGNIPVIKTDRGGQVTYHGPGQLVVYPLLDLKRRGISIRHYVFLLEQTLIDLLDSYGIKGERRPGAPGVYVNNRKIAALGIRVRHGCCYHGLAINVDMDLTPFAGINPCGYAGLEVTCLSDLGVQLSVLQVCQNLLPLLAGQLGFDNRNLPLVTDLT